jgi:hypothetical protein
MKTDQIVTQLFNSLRRNVVKHNEATQLDIYAGMLDEINREMGLIEEAGAGDADERFPETKEPLDEDSDSN